MRCNWRASSAESLPESVTHRIVVNPNLLGNELDEDLSEFRRPLIRKVASRGVRVTLLRDAFLRATHPIST
jgi:hypothetical protein